MIDKEDLDRLKEIFVTRKECEVTTESLQAQVSKETTDIAVIKVQCRAILGILSAVGGAILALVIKQFWG